MAGSADRGALEDDDPIAGDVLLPSQFPPRHGVTPERSLWLSVLVDAIECFQKHHGARARPRRQLFEDAEDWIFATGDDAAFSFEAICDHLSLDADYLRRGLQRWREREQARALSSLGAEWRAPTARTAEPTRLVRHA